MSVNESNLGTPAPAAVTAAPTTPGSFTSEIPSTPAASTTAVAERPFMDSVPTEFRDKPFIQDIAKNEKPWDALFKSYASAQELIGKKTEGVAIPGEGATPEAIAAFNKAIGVPEKADGYAYAPPDISKEPEAVQAILSERAKDTTFIDSMRTEALKAGVTPKQFSALAAAFDAQQIAQVKAQVDGQATSAKTYTETETKIFNELYGAKGDQVKTLAKDILAKVIPQNIRDSKNPNLALVAAAMYINEKVFKNDTIGGTNMGAPQMTKEVIREQILKLRSDPAFRDPFARNHKDLNTKVDALYNQLHEGPPKE